MKIGVVGGGKWGQNHIRTLHQLGCLGAVAEAQPEVAAALRGQYEGVPVFEDFRCLLSSDLAGIVVATTAETHFAIATDVLSAGKDVLIEKPMTLCADEARQLVRQSEEAKRVLMVGHLLLFQPAIERIRDAIASGRIGALRSVHQERLNFGRARAHEDVIWSLGVHDVAVVLYLVGASPAGIQCVKQDAVQPSIADDAYVHLSFPNGVQGHLHSSWLWPERRRRLTVIGERAMLVFDEADGNVILHERSIDGTLNHVDNGSSEVFSGASEPLRLELENFMQCIKTREQPRSSGTSALAVMDVLEATSRQAVHV